MKLSAKEMVAAVAVAAYNLIITIDKTLLNRQYCFIYFYYIYIYTRNDIDTKKLLKNGSVQYFYKAKTVIKQNKLLYMFWKHMVFFINNT